MPVILMVVALLGISAGAALATEQLEVPINTVVRSAEGELTVLESRAVPAEMVGYTCTVTAEAVNQRSAHPGNDIIVSTNGADVVLSDVEAEPGKVTTASASVVLGETMTLTLRMGSDGVFSGGVTATFECVPPETTTTTTEQPTTTQPPSTTQPPPTEPTSTTTTTSAVSPTTAMTTSTTQPPASSTTTPESTTSTTVTGVAGKQVERDVLPFTGVNVAVAGAVALGLLGAGIVMRRIAD